MNGDKDKRRKVAVFLRVNESKVFLEEIIHRGLNQKFGYSTLIKEIIKKVTNGELVTKDGVNFFESKKAKESN